MHCLCQFANNLSLNLINQRCVFGMYHRFPCVCVKQSVTIFHIDQKLPQRLFWSCTLLLAIKKSACFSGINLTSEANIAGRNKHHAFSLKHKTMLCFCFRFQLLYFLQFLIDILDYLPGLWVAALDLSTFTTRGRGPVKQVQATEKHNIHGRKRR